MKFNPFAMAIFSFVFFAACKKNNSDNTVPNNDPKLLRQFIMLDGTDSSTNNTFTYDSQNRILTATARVYDNSLFQGTVTHTFSYNGNDTLPASKRIDYNGSGFSDTGYEFLFYDAAGRMIVDSVDQDATGHYTTYRYAYAPDHILISTSYFDTITSHITLSNGNIVSESDTLYSTVIWTDPNKIDIQASYDNYTNPFYKTGVRRPVLYVPELYVDDYFMPALKNNLTHATTVRTGSSTTTVNVQFSYTYDADGYPLTTTQTTSGVTYTGTYYYY